MNQPVEWVDHLTWFKSLFVEPDKSVICHFNSQVVGICYVKGNISSYEVSIYVSPKFHYLGAGRTMLKSIVELNQVSLEAVIHDYNLKSIKLFKSFGFIPTENPVEITSPFTRYSLSWPRKIEQ